MYPISSRKSSVSQHNKRFPLSLLASTVAAVIAAPISMAAVASTEQGSDSAVVDTGMLQVVGQATSGLDGFIGQDELDNKQAGTLSDIFAGNSEISAGGSVQMGQKIYLRNIGENMLNISIDGAEQAGAVFHHSGSVSVEPELLKQVEVEAGAGSATAGPGALGGSVRFVTKDPEDLLKAGETVGALVKTQYSSNGEGVKNSATVFAQDKSEKFGFMLSGVHSDQDNLEDGDGNEIIGTENERTSLYTKVVAKLTPEQTIKVSYEDLKDEGDVLYKPELAGGPRNVAEPTRSERQTAILNYGFNALDNDLLNLSLTVYNTKQEEGREFRGTEYSGYVKSTGLTVQNTSLVGDHELVYGLNYRDDEAFLYDVDVGSSRFKETGDVKGVFVQDTFEATPDLTVSGGVRFDQYKLTDVNKMKFDDSGFSPNLSANYVINPELSISAGYGEVLRGVELKDSFKLSSSSNAPDLEAERAKNLELGVNYSANGLNLTAGVYRSVIENPIGGSEPWSKESINLEHDIETTGFTIKGDYSWDKLSVSASYNSADTELNNETVTRYVYSSSAASIGDTLVLDLNYQVNDAIELGWRSTQVASINGITLDVGGYDLKADKPGYDVHDLYARWEPMGKDKLTVTLSVNNLFNEQYISHASVEDFSSNPDWEVIKGAPEAGRDIRLSAALRF